MAQYNTQDAFYMAHALRLAERGQYTTAPNPCVGCVIVRADKIIGSGWHQKAGQAHAEPQALAQAGALAQGATAYVTLEPCSHFGRTPPCADALIQAGIARVVIAMQDPNPQVAGSGSAKLQAAGISVQTGLMHTQAQTLNQGFIKRMQTGRPWVCCKQAMSLDGRTGMANGDSQWITGPKARADVHRLRAQNDAIICGIDSVLKDDCRLTVRHEIDTDHDADHNTNHNTQTASTRQPLRVILDSRLRLPINARILQPPGTVWVITAQNLQEEKAQTLRKMGVKIHHVPDAKGERINLQAVLALLAQEGCNRVLLETGAQLSSAFIRQHLVDEWIIYMASKILGSNAQPLLQLPLHAMSDAVPVQINDIRACGNDWRIRLSFSHPSGNMP